MDKLESGYRSYWRYTAGRLRPDGGEYPPWHRLTPRCRQEWQALALQADLGGGTVERMGPRNSD